MRLGQGLGEIAIALVGHDDRSAGFGHQEIRTGDADVGRQEFFAQHGARFAQQGLRLREAAVGRESRVHAAEVGLDLCLGEMYRRRDDVRRQFVAKLDDVLAEIGLDRGDGVFRQEIVEADFLGHHRFALGHGLGVERAADVEDDRTRVGGRSGEMHVAARGEHATLVFLEIEIEMRQGVILDVAGRIPQRLELGQLVGHLLAPRDEVRLENVHRALQLAVCERGVCVLLEGR